MSAEKVVVAKNLTKIFSSRRAVNGISFSVIRGETFGLLGPNGAGKSTTMRMIACRSPVSGGDLRIEGLDTKIEDRRIRRLIGVVPQENNLDPDLNVRENLRVYAGYFRLERFETDKRIDELLDFIRLRDRADSKVDELSGGMKRRLMIARALLHRPRILLLDEPTAGLDPNVRQDIWEKLEELRREENLTIMLSTHYMEEAEKLCHRLLVLSQGCIVAEGVPRDLIEKEASHYVLEVREAAAFTLQPGSNGIRSRARGSTHLYFAETAEKLLPLMAYYKTGQMIVRPSNLEDVFLQLTENEEN